MRGHRMMLIAATLALFAWAAFVTSRFLVNRINPIPSSWVMDLIVPIGIPAILLGMLWYWYRKSSRNG